MSKAIKKRLMKLTALISLATLFLLVTFTRYSFACFNPTDNFAFEVVLNKEGVSYDLSMISKARNVKVVEKPLTIIYRSHYNKDVAIILREIDKEFLKGLSIRLQVPTKFVKIIYNVTRIEVISKEKLSLDKKLLESLDYKVKSVEEKGMLKVCASKDGIRIDIFSISKEFLKKEDEEKRFDKFRSKIIIIVKNKDVTSDLEDEFKNIVLSLGVGLDEWENRKVSKNKIENIDLKAHNEYLESFDFKKGIEVELQWLRDNGVVKGLSDSDIKEIVDIAKAGLAGHNSRVVWEDGWKPYYKTRNPMLIRGIDCSGFSADKLPEGTAKVLTNQTATTYVETKKSIVEQVSYIGIREQAIILSSVLAIALIFIALSVKKK